METRDILKRAGLRPTRVRIAVLRAVADSPRPLSAAEIESRLRRSGAPVGAASVYRAIASFVESGILRKAAGGREARVETAAGGARARLICAQCGKSMAIDDPAANRLASSLVKKSGFVGAENALYLYADCKNEICAR